MGEAVFPRESVFCQVSASAFYNQTNRPRTGFLERDDEEGVVEQFEEEI